MSFTQDELPARGTLQGYEPRLSALSMPGPERGTGRAALESPSIFSWLAET